MMKKAFLTITMALVLGSGATAQGAADWWEDEREEYFGTSLAFFDWNEFVGTFDWVSRSEVLNRTDLSEFFIPGAHGIQTDVNEGPIGSGIAVLAGLGAAYAFAKRRKKK